MATVILAGTKASGTITIVDNDSVPLCNIAVNGINLTEGTQWSVGADAAASATNLAAAITTATATTLTTATSSGPVVTVVANSAGVAGNSITIALTNGFDFITFSGPTLSGGATANGLLSASPLRLRNLRVKSTGSALGVQVLNGATASGTEYDLVTGVTATTVVRNYVKGLTLPAGGYLVLAADVTQVVAQFDLI